MNVKVASPSEIKELSDLSISLGNIPLYPNQAIASLLVKDNEIVGFAACQVAWHTAGSWVKESLRRQGYSRILRARLETELRERGIPMYFSLPEKDFEKSLFAKYGPVSERLAQVKAL